MTILHYWRIAWQARLVILGTMASAVVIAFVALHFQAKVYTAQATILSPKEASSQGGMSMLSAALGGGGRDGGALSLPSIFGSGPMLSTNQDMFVALLKSRTIFQEVVGELARKYGADLALKILSVDVVTRDKGVIGLAVESTDPALAAETANLYFEVLDRTIERLAQQATRRLEERYVDQLQRAAKEVGDAEVAVMKFQAENRIGPIESLAREGSTRGGGSGSGGGGDYPTSLRAAIMSLELQREVLRMRMTDQHPQMQELAKQIAELKKQYSKNLFGAPMDLPGETPGQGRKEFFVSAEKMTPVQFAYLKLYRTLKIQEAFYTGALQSLEQLKYNEGVNRVRVDPLDRGVPPLGPTRPRVLLVLLVAAVGGLIVPILVIDAGAYFRRLVAEERGLRSPPVPRERRAELLGPLAPPDDARLPPDPFSVAGRGRQ